MFTVLCINSTLSLSSPTNYPPLHTHTHTHTHLMAPCPGLPGWASTRKVKVNLDFTEARDSEWQWHHLGHMQVCTSLQTDNHASTPPLSFFYRMPFLPPNQQRQSTEGLTTTTPGFIYRSTRLLTSLICSQAAAVPRPRLLSMISAVGLMPLHA